MTSVPSPVTLNHSAASDRSYQPDLGFHNPPLRGYKDLSPGDPFVSSESRTQQPLNSPSTAQSSAMERVAAAMEPDDWIELCQIYVLLSEEVISLGLLLPNVFLDLEPGEVIGMPVVIGAPNAANPEAAQDGDMEEAGNIHANVNEGGH